MSKHISRESKVGKHIQIGNISIRPVVRSLRLQPPAYRWAFFWQHPKAVLVQSPHGEQQTLPIRDVTRRAQIILLGIGFFGSLLIWLAFRKK